MKFKSRKCLFSSKATPKKSILPNVFLFLWLVSTKQHENKGKQGWSKKSRGLEIITCRSFFNFLAGVRIFASFLPPLYNFCFHFTLGNTNSRPVRSMFAATLRKWHENKIRLHSLLKI